MPPRSHVTFASSTDITACPFLYHTKTIVQHKPRVQIARFITSTTPVRRKPSDLAQSSINERSSTSSLGATDQRPEQSFLKQKAAQVSSRRPKLGPTITPAEQAAFDKIWDLFKKPDPSTVKARATSTNHADTNYQNILELFASLPQQGHIPHHASNSDELSSVNQPRPNRTASQTPSQPQLNHEGAMAEIQDFLKETTAHNQPGSVSPTTSAEPTVESTVHTIVSDAAEALTTALTSTTIRPDLAMWRVAEEKIFPLIQLLRPSTPSLSSQQPTQPESTAQLHPLIPPTLPLLPILTQTYPSLTLLLLRLYATNLPTSPYVLALLPTLKSLGPTSYVLGAHTHFYDTLLALYWRMYSDLRGMNSLLAEMEANGVEFGLGTWEVIKMVGEDRAKDLEGRGERGNSWWERMEQRVWWERVGIRWKEVIRLKLEEKGVSTGEVMREGGVETEMDRENREYVVTL